MSRGVSMARRGSTVAVPVCAVVFELCDRRIPTTFCAIGAVAHASALESLSSLGKRGLGSGPASPHSD